MLLSHFVLVPNKLCFWLSDECTSKSHDNLHGTLKWELYGLAILRPNIHSHKMNEWRHCCRVPRSHRSVFHEADDMSGRINYRSARASSLPCVAFRFLAGPETVVWNADRSAVGLPNPHGTCLTFRRIAQLQVSRCSGPRAGQSSPRLLTNRTRLVVTKGLLLEMPFLSYVFHCLSPTWLCLFYLTTAVSHDRSLHGL